MKNFLATLCGLLAVQVAFAAEFPAKLAGIWATEDATFDGDYFLGGVAVYLDKAGKGLMMGGPSSPACANVSCARPTGISFHAVAGTTQNEIVCSMKDMTGKTMSATCMTYDPSTDTLRNEMMGMRGMRFMHRTRSVPPDVMNTYSVSLRQAEKDLPSGFAAYIMPSHAMEPTLSEGVQVLVDVRVYQSGIPQRGDIVVYEAGKDKRLDYIHRVVGLPGDQLEIRNGKLLLNGQAVEAPYAASAGKTTLPYSRTMAPVTVPDGTVFLLGDNWDGSLDSRAQGVIPLRDVKGRVFMQKPSMFEGDFSPVK